MVPHEKVSFFLFITVNNRLSTMPRKSKNFSFRVNRKAFGLTYSCPVDADDNPIQEHEEILELLNEKGPNQYIIGKELHESGKVHWHVYVKYDSIIDSTDVRLFDLLGVHPNIVDGAPGKGWQAYCVKDKDFVSNFYQNDPYKIAVDMDNPDEALNYLWEKQPRNMLERGHLIEQNLRKRKHIPVPQKRYFGPFPEEFYPPYDWDLKTHSILIVGPSGMGKTQFGRYFLGDCDYIKGTLEPLKQCVFDKPLLFDEITMLDLDPEQSKEITDVENGGSIKMRFKNTQIPPGVPRIFIHNIEYPFRNPSNAVYGRRVLTHVIDGPFAAARVALIEAERVANAAAVAAREARLQLDAAETELVRQNAEEGQSTLKFKKPADRSSSPALKSDDDDGPRISD